MIIQIDTRNDTVIYCICKIRNAGGKNMNFLTDEMLFYGGLIITGISVLFGIIYFFISKIKKMRLFQQLNQEYGEKVK